MIKISGRILKLQKAILGLYFIGLARKKIKKWKGERDNFYAYRRTEQKKIAMYKCNVIQLRSITITHLYSHTPLTFVFPNMCNDD